jgi:hypothetical protein
MGSIVDRQDPAQICVLEADPDLAAGLPPDQKPIAAQRACAREEVLVEEALNLPGSRWDGAIGLLVLDGILIRTVGIGDRTSTELLGAGDLLRPWQRDEAESMLHCEIDWRVLEPARAAVLDERFAAAIAPWPQIWSAILSRTMRRTRSQAVAMALSHMNRVDDRLLLVLWHFADRWGRVRPDGVVVRLPLTHETLAELVGARRPSVTSSLGSLARDGLVLPGESRGEWILTPAGRARLDESQNSRAAA